MHDTTIDAEVGETIRGRGNVEKAAKDSGYTVQEVSTGLRPAIIEFLNDHPEWTIEKVYNNNNGLTILRRV